MLYFTFSIFFIWRIVLFIFASIGSRILPFVPRFPYSEIFLTNSGLPSWIWKFANFDGVHYLTISEKGYTQQFTQVFFPLYPVLIGFFKNLIPYVNSVILAIVISSLFLFFAFFIFERLLDLDYKKKQIKWISIFLMFFPTSFYFGSIYTESLFLFLIFLSFYFARKKRWVLSGIIGALASATRITGIFLLPALLWEWNISNRITNKELRIKNKENKILLNNFVEFVIHNSRFLIRSPILYLVPLGLLIYMIYLQIAFGDALYFWHAQGVFGAQRTGTGIILLPQIFFRYIKIFLSIPPFSEAFLIPLLEFLSTIFALGLMIIAHIKNVRLSYLIFAWPCLLLPTLTGTLSSMPRYILSVFPIFIVLGLIESKNIKIFLISLFLLILFTLTVLFTAGHWVG
jgi:hypothetical protein